MPDAALSPPPPLEPAPAPPPPPAASPFDKLIGALPLCGLSAPPADKSSDETAGASKAPKAKEAWSEAAPEAAAAMAAVVGASKGDKKELSKAGLAVFDAHRLFITSCVEQLEVHTFMLSQAEPKPGKSVEGAQLHDYVGGLEALLRERQASVTALQAQLQTFRDTIGGQ